MQALNVEILGAEDHLQLAVSKEAAKTTGQGLLDGAENLPDPPATSDLVIANSLAGVDQAVQNVDKFAKRA